MKYLKAIDLFCGIGGFRLGLEPHKVKFVFASDNDERVRSTYFENFGEKPEGDIKKIAASEIPKHNILCAGFPCQSFSSAGKGKPDLSLFMEILRVVRYHTPQILLLENVPNLQSIQDGEIYGIIVGRLMAEGYTVNTVVLNASDYNIPQSRRRLYFVCIRKGTKKFGRFNEPKKEKPTVFVKDILDEHYSGNFHTPSQKIVWNKTEESHLHEPICLGYYSYGGQGQRIYSIYGHSPTQVATGARALFVVGDSIRRLSLIEAKRIMGLPDNFVATSYKQVGNAVIPKMIDLVFDNIEKL